MDKIVDVFPGKNPGDVSLGLESGITTVFAKYDSEHEAREMITMLAEFMAGSKRDAFMAPDGEAVKTSMQNRSKSVKARNISGKKTKGHGGS